MLTKVTGPAGDRAGIRHGMYVTTACASPGFGLMILVLFLSPSRRQGFPNFIFAKK